jgi:hypothetical protein
MPRLSRYLVIVAASLPPSHLWIAATKCYLYLEKVIKAFDKLIVGITFKIENRNKIKR